MSSTVLPRAGEIVAGRYVIVAVRGAGMMGVVYEAEDLTTRQSVALKVLRPDLTAMPMVAERLLREGRMVAQMQSPHIVRVLDVGATASGLPYFAMELLTGHDLAALLDRGRTFSIGEAVGLARQACEGLAEAHAMGVIHRDIKPHNMFLAKARDGSERLVLLDFGVSKVLGAQTDLTLTQASIGTPLYMAPEQVRSARNVDERSDVWALGVVLFELCAGAAPFDGESAHAVTASIVADEPKKLRAFLADAPAALELVIATALQKDPQHRYPSALAFADALAPFASGATPPPANEQPTLVTNVPYAFFDATPPESGPGSTVLAAPLPPPPVLATVFAPHTPPQPQLPPPSLNPTQQHVPTAFPAAAPPSRKQTTALLVATGALLLLGLGLLVMLGLAERQRPTRASQSAAPSAHVASGGSVAELIASARENQGLAPFEPCVLRVRDSTLVAVGPRAPLAEPLADLDPRFAASVPPSFMLEGVGAKGTGDVVLVAITPLSPELRDPATPLLVVTDQHLYVGLLGERAFETVESDEQRGKLKDAALRGAQAWVVAAEGQAPLSAFAAALGLLADGPASVTFAVPLAKTSTREPPSLAAGSACEPAWSKAARWVSDSEWLDIGPATRVAEQGCGREAPWLSGRSVRLLTFPGARDACLEEFAVPSEGQACALDAARKLAIALPRGKRAEPVRFDFVFRGAPVRALCTGK